MHFNLIFKTPTSPDFESFDVWLCKRLGKSSVTVMVGNGQTDNSSKNSTPNLHWNLLNSQPKQWNLHEFLQRLSIPECKVQCVSPQTAAFERLMDLHPLAFASQLPPSELPYVSHRTSNRCRLSHHHILSTSRNAAHVSHKLSSCFAVQLDDRWTYGLTCRWWLTRGWSHARSNTNCGSGWVVPNS